MGITKEYTASLFVIPSISMQTSKIRQSIQVTRANWIWTEADPDVELIEPEIRVTNRLQYEIIKEVKCVFSEQSTTADGFIHPDQSRQASSRLQSDVLRHYCILCFQVKFFQSFPCLILYLHLGISTAQIIVSRRPADCFKSSYEFKSQQKDRMFIQLAPVFGWSTPAATVFHRANFYEKLKISIVYNPNYGDGLQLKTFCVNTRWMSTFQTKDEWSWNWQSTRMKRRLKKQVEDQNAGK
uniref:Uncharacterized protein n=1 Tax=Ditylenchus dipsaci TaxID=166011 RepID=A0A915D9Q8_9BILA